MKPATNDVEFIFDDEKNLIGVNLGWDYTAEHEWGIDELKKSFGIGDKSSIFKKVFGVANRRVSLVPEDLFFAKTTYKNNTYYVLALPNPYTKKYLEFTKKGHLCKSSIDTFRLMMWRFIDETSKHKVDVVSSWDSKTFAIATNTFNKDNLETIYNALLNKDAIIMLSGSNNPFANAGLCIFIESKLPQKFLDDLYEDDKEYYKLQKAVEKTKIIEKLKKANKEYYALCPTFEEDGTLKFWLNPQEQSKYNYGWFTVKDLLLWIKEKGPIIKEK